MTQSMGKIIKSLSKERGYTQEVLAEKVGVSFQAVSKWENDIGMPDVSQIVPIARVFGVSTDVLFAYECDEDENVEKIISDVEESDVSILDNYPKLLDAVKLYPNNETLLRYTLKHGKWIMISHFRRREKDKERAEMLIPAAETVIRLAQRLLEMTGNTDIYAREALIYAYCYVGNFTAAHEEAAKVPDHKETQGRFEAYILAMEGDIEGSIDRRRKNVASALNDISNSIGSLSRVYKRMGRPEDAIAVYLKCIDIFNAAGEEGEFEYPHDTLATICQRIAELYSGMEKYNEAIDWLEKMFDYVEKRREYSSREDNKSKSLILGVSPYYDVHEINLKYDAQHYLRMTYARPAFKVLFELPRFKELLQKYNM